jgi:hypothetical protein
LKQWETFRANPDLLERRNQAVGEGGKRWRKENPEKNQARIEAFRQSIQRSREENPDKWERVGAINSVLIRKLREENPEEFKEGARKGGVIAGNQKWQCTVTGKVLGPGPLTQYQRARGIDPSNRVRIE